MGVSSGMYLGTEPRIDQETAKIHVLFLEIRSDIYILWNRRQRICSRFTIGYW